jgi:hypothetical protein
MNLELFLGNRVERKMQERGITEEEIRQTIQAGRISPADLGRSKATRVFTAGYHREGIDYRHKEIQVVFVEEPWATVVVTVIARYGVWGNVE